MPALAREFEVVAVGQRGIGLSDKPEQGYDTGTLANDLAGLMDALGHDRFAVGGVDTGMLIGYAMAADHPGRVARLAVGEAPLPGITPPNPLILPDQVVDRAGADGAMTGKVAVITGASEGIGVGLVAGYRGRGWAVVASDRTLRPSKDPEVLTVEGGIADPVSAGRVISAALDRFGRVDTLVNAASVVISKPFTDYTAADYALMAGVNLAGFFWLTQRAVAEMATRYGGHVVTISATVAESADSGTSAALAALTTGGLAAATRSLAIEYGFYGIRVNAVSPGVIQAPAHPPASNEHLGGRLPPLGRVGQVSDVVDGVLFLESSPHITGEILHVDGGQIAAR